MSSKEDFIPTNDTQFAQWLSIFDQHLRENLDILGLQPESVAFVTDLREAMQSALQRVTRAQSEARGAMRHKRAVRKAAEKAIRPFVRHIHETPGIDDSLRLYLGLHAHAGHRMRHELMGEAPALKLDTVNGRVAVHFGTSPQNEWRNTRPKWARGCIIYRKKDGEDGFQMVGYATQSPFYDEIDEPAIQVTYAARYRGRRNTDLGPHSLGASIAAGKAGARKPRKTLAEAA